MMIALFCIMQLGAQTTVTATRSGYVQNTSTTSSLFYETGLTLKAETATWARIGYVELPVSDPGDFTTINFQAYFYSAAPEGTYDITISSKNGALPDDICYSSQPTGLTEVGILTVTSDAYGWVSIDITNEYIAAYNAGQTALMLRMLSPDTSGLLNFYPVSTTTDYAPCMVFLIEGCDPEYNSYSYILEEGDESIVVNGEVVTESGTYIEKGFRDCGAEKVDTTHVLFIADGTIETSYIICEGDELPIQVSPTEYKYYTEAGTYTDVITSTDGNATQTTVSVLTVNPLPVVEQLDDVEIRQGEYTTLDAGEGYSTYQWYNNGVAIDGATSQTLVVSSEIDDFVIGQNEINVVVTDATGCEGTCDWDAWVTINGNFLVPTRDMYLEEAGDRMLEDLGYLQVKYDTWGDTNYSEPNAPYYTKETYLAFDLTEIPEEAYNFTLRLYCYALDVNTLQSATTQGVNVSCKFYDGLYAEDMIWTTKPGSSELTPLASNLFLAPDMEFGQVEWAINDIFVSEVLPVYSQITVVLAASNDAYSTLVKFYDNTTTLSERLPVIAYEMPESDGIVETSTTTEVVLAPNPVKDMLYIKSTAQFETAYVYDLAGRVVLAASVSNNCIDMSQLQAGQYIVSLVSDTEKVNKIVTKK